MLSNRLLGALLIIVCAHIVSSRVEKEITIKVGPGTTECFYIALNANDNLELEYQVLNGEYGDLDIDFLLFNHDGNILKREDRRSDAMHSTNVAETGEYKFCFDNYFSSISAKTVFFSVVTTNPEAGWIQDPDSFGDIDFDKLQMEEHLDMKVEDIKATLDRIRSQVGKSRFIQIGLKAMETRDRHTQENNYTRINSFSLLCVVVMICTALVQVYLLRSLFDDKNKLHRLWKGNTH